MQIVYTTVPNMDNAEFIAKELVCASLVVCVNIFKSTSVYSWNNELKKSDECVILIKTKCGLVDDVMNKIKELSFYDVPAIFSISVDKIDSDYACWLDGVSSTLDS